ncbi:MAG: EAL domain-containing protein [Acidobacteriota bacterium]
MMTRRSVLIVQADPAVREQLAAALIAPGRTVVTCGDAAAARTILEKHPVAAVVADVRLNDDFGFDGLALLDVLPRSLTVLMTAHEMPEALIQEVARRGADCCLRNDDLETIAARVAAVVPAGLDGPPRVIRVPAFETLITSVNLIPCFQPIVNLSEGDGAPHGYESLARYRGQVPFCDCEFLFQYAARLGRVADLELACLRQTLRWGATLARRGKLFINLHPEVFSKGGELSRTVLQECRANGVPLENLVLEITEQGPLVDVQAAATCAEELRAAGVQFAFDDVGVSYSHLSFIDQIKPAYLKISQHFGTDFETSGSKRKIIRNIVALAADFDCEVVIEGIEEAATAGAATEMGAKFGQGFLYSKPRDAGAFSS